MKLMETSFKNKMNGKKNKGSAIVMVLVIIAFISILVSVLYYKSILNYQMKRLDYKSKDTFYSAESALDEIKIGLQKVVVNATNKAYIDVMQNYQNYTNEQRATQFRALYGLYVQDEMKGADSSHYDVTKLRGFLVNTALVSGVGADVDVPSGANTMKSYSITDPSNPSAQPQYCVALENVRVVYTGENDFVSIVQTDIQLLEPKIDFNEAFRLPDILEYCVIANEKIDVDATSSANVLEGNVYAGEGGIEAKNSLTIKGADSIVTDGTLSIENGQTFEIIDSSGNTNIWANNISVDSSTMKLNGNIFVADDTSITGSNGSVVFGGSYIGFGDGTKADANAVELGSNRHSSIVVNGVNSSLDFRTLQTLTLAGNAYINVSSSNTENLSRISLATGGEYQDGTSDGADGSINSNIYSKHDINVMMGESIAVKSDQLAYLVPPECIGYYEDECRLGTNPVVESNLVAFITEKNNATEEKKALYKEVRLDKVPSLVEFANGSDIKVDIRKVYRPSADNSVKLVYYYLDFQKQEDANKFFKQYYANNKTKMDNYISHYISDIQFGNLESMNVNIAGNILKKGDGGQYTLVEDGLSEITSNSAFSSSMKYYKNTYTALCTKLVNDYSLLQDPDKIRKADVNQGLFANVIKIEDLDDATTPLLQSGWFSGNYICFGENRTTPVGYYVNNLSAPYSVPNSSDLRVIIARGDVILDHDFTGIIICGGTLTLKNGARIIKDADGVSDALKQPFHDMNVASSTKTDVLAIQLFRDGSNGLENNVSGGTGGSAGDHVEIENLVTYMNWNKQ